MPRKALADRQNRAQPFDMEAANSVTSANGRRRGPGRPFPPGQSGNPLGRPKAALDVQELARAHTAEAIDTLVRALDDPKHCVAAAAALLDRAWGRPTTFVAGDATAAPLAIQFEWAAAAPPAAVPEEPVIDGDTDGLVLQWTDTTALTR